MKRALALLCLIAALLPLAAQAQESVAQNEKFIYETAYMRNTTAGSTVARNAFWGAAQNAAGFTDSTVFRRGATTRTVYDTTMGYNNARFLMPPGVGNTIPPNDSTKIWLIVRVRQDTTAANFASGTGLTSSSLDSVRVAAEYSYNGVSWFSCSGTPTYRFDTVFLTSGEDGLQSPTLIGVENSPGEDAVSIPFKWGPEVGGTQSYIVNKQLPVAGVFVRFIVGGAYTGQFKVDIGHWSDATTAD